MHELVEQVADEAVEVLLHLVEVWGAGLVWLFTVLFSGILIGLGGPFWFDLAMRLSQVKQALSGTAPAQPTADAPVPPRDKAIAKAADQLAPTAPPAPGKQPWDDKPW